MLRGRESHLSAFPKTLVPVLPGEVCANPVSRMDSEMLRFFAVSRGILVLVILKGVRISEISLKLKISLRTLAINTPVSFSPDSDL